MTRSSLATPILLLLPVLPLRAQELQTAHMGECTLESGEVILDCRMGYRTVGRLNDEKTNAILFPTWFGGTTEQILPLVGEDGFIDGERYFVILVDAFGNGVSSSPSNSPTQPGGKFPRITIRDMVRHQHRLLTEILDIHHLRAVTGISMGGMQTFEWAVAYPGFAGKALPIVGSPRLATYDIVLWETYARVLAWSLDCECQTPAAVTQGLFFLMGGPDYQARVNPRESLGAVRERFEEATISPGRAWDLTSQLHAMIDHDVSAPFGGDMDLAAARTEADMLVVVGLTDHVVTPGPALSFADLVGAEVLELTNDCGHNAYSCAPAAFKPRVGGFLAR